MACYISAGHHLKDPGAIANGLQENMLTIRVRDRVTELLRGLGATVYNDKDDETLAEVISRFKPGDGSVLLDLHFDAASSSASGSTGFYADNPSSPHSRDFAHDLAEDCANALGIPSRGSRTESESHRGKLGFVRQQGICAILEIAFITNPDDMTKFEANFNHLCENIASTVYYYDQMIP